MFGDIKAKCLEEEFEYTKGIIRIRKSKKDRQHNGRKEKQRSTNNTHKTKDRCYMMIKIFNISDIILQIWVHKISLTPSVHVY